MQNALQLIDQSAAAAALLRPIRLRILEELREPDSAAEVARRLALPRQRVAYHVKELEKKGLVEHVGERKRGNCVERLVRSSARHYVIAPQALGGVGVEAADVQDRFSSAYLVASAAQTIRDVAALQGRARAARKKLATLTYETEIRFATPADQAAFAEELGDLLVGLTVKYHAPTAAQGRSYRFTVGGHPLVGGGGRAAAERSGVRPPGGRDDD